MNYAEIYKDEIVNGKGVGVSLYVSGCDLSPHCDGCFNSEAWDFNYGKPFTDEVKDKFLDLIDKPYIDRVTILGGEPFASKNVDDVDSLVQSIRSRFGKSKKIWIFSGYTYEELYKDNRVLILLSIDVLVDGRFVETEKDLTLPFRGSRNQRIIDVPASLGNDELTLLEV